MHSSSVNAGNTASGPPGQSFDASRCKTGDRLLARINEVASSGRTVLTIAGVKAVAATSLGVRAGDRVLLEVVPGGNAAALRSNPGETPSQGPAARQDPLFEIVVRQGGRRIRLPVRLQTAATRATACDPGEAHRPTLSRGPLVSMLATMQTTLPERSVQAIAAWCDVLRRRLQQMKPSGFHGAGYDRPSPPAERARRGPGDAGERPVRRGADTPESAPHGSCAGGHRDGGMLHLRLRRSTDGSSRDASAPDIEAVFVLFRERIGALRTDLRMGPRRLSVRFCVETEDCRVCFAEALADLERALSRWGGDCRCRVEVAPQKIEAFWQGEGVAADDVWMGEGG